jgi:exopolysaccharide production protein ExoZ
MGLKLNSIQYLRAFAAAAVVAYHASNTLLGHADHLIDLDYGTYGVDIFFVVSGFIMFYTTFGVGMRPAVFFVKRLIRIFPLYFILSTTMFVMVLLSPSTFNKASPDFLAYCESIFFIPHWNPRLHDLQPILGPGWTLNYEMFFYVLFAMSLFIRHRLSGIAVLPMIGTLVIIGYLHPIHNPVVFTYTSPMMLEFCLGIVVAATFTVPANSNLRWPIALMIACVACASYFYFFRADAYGNDMTRPFFVGVPCALVVAVFVAMEGCGRLPRFAFLSLVGDASYSLYLVQVFVIGIGLRMWRYVGSSNSILSHAVFIVLIMAASIATAIVIYRCVEFKVSRSLTARYRRLCSASTVAATHSAVTSK